MNQAQFEAQLDSDLTLDLNARMVATCQRLCMDSYSDRPSLNEPESYCLDNCASKYLTSQKLALKEVEIMMKKYQHENKIMEQPEKPKRKRFGIF